MAILDIDEDVVVVRIAYDGPPLSGKTSSVNALASRLSQEVYCPEERNGRTAYFDWLDYTGGRFEGRPIRCQIVSVPGQRELSDRRQWILRDADAVVFVANSNADDFPESLEYLRELLTFVGEAQPPVGVVVQANKRDLPDAVPAILLHTKLAEVGEGVAVIESCAQAGAGIRESFVFAVRLALDRVRAQLAAGSLQKESRASEDGKTFFASMKSALSAAPVALPETVASAPPEGERALSDELSQVIRESATPPALSPAQVPSAQVPETPPASPRLRSVPRRATQGATQTLRPPTLPAASVPSGAIWPPVDGRVILLKATQAELVMSKDVRLGLWIANGDGWRVMSAVEASYSSFEEGRTALVLWARLHASCADVLSGQRCVALAPDGPRWRLWQLIPKERTLQDELENLSEETAEEALRKICRAVAAVMQLRSKTNSTLASLPASLTNVGTGVSGQPIYVGPMPHELRAEAQQGDSIGLGELLKGAGTEPAQRWSVSMASQRPQLLSEFTPEVVDAVEAHLGSA